MDFERDAGLDAESGTGQAHYHRWSPCEGARATFSVAELPLRQGARERDHLGRDSGTAPARQLAWDGGVPEWTRHRFIREQVRSMLASVRFD